MRPMALCSLIGSANEEPLRRERTNESQDGARAEKSAARMMARVQAPGCLKNESEGTAVGWAKARQRRAHAAARLLVRTLRFAHPTTTELTTAGQTSQSSGGCGQSWRRPSVGRAGIAVIASHALFVLGADRLVDHRAALRAASFRQHSRAIEAGEAGIGKFDELVFLAGADRVVDHGQAPGLGAGCANERRTRQRCRRRERCNECRPRRSDLVCHDPCNFRCTR